MGDVDPATGRRTGPLGKVVDYVKFNVFNPLKKAMVGDPSDPASVDKSIVGTTKRLFKEAVDGGARFLFGEKRENEDGSITRQGGLFGGVVNWFSGKSKQLKDFLLGKGGDGKQPGLLVELREKFDRMVERARRVVVLSDASKFEQVSLHHIALLDQIHAVVTDAGIGADFREALQQRGIEVIVADALP